MIHTTFELHSIDAIKTRSFDRPLYVDIKEVVDGFGFATKATPSRVVNLQEDDPVATGEIKYVFTNRDLLFSILPEIKNRFDNKESFVTIEDVATAILAFQTTATKNAIDAINNDKKEIAAPVDFSKEKAQRNFFLWRSSNFLLSSCILFIEMQRKNRDFFLRANTTFFDSGDVSCKILNEMIVAFNRNEFIRNVVATFNEDLTTPVDSLNSFESFLNHIDNEKVSIATLFLYFDEVSCYSYRKESRATTAFEDFQLINILCALFLSFATTTGGSITLLRLRDKLIAGATQIFDFNARDVLKDLNLYSRICDVEDIRMIYERNKIKEMILN